MILELPARDVHAERQAALARDATHGDGHAGCRLGHAALAHGR